MGLCSVREEQQSTAGMIINRIGFIQKRKEIETNEENCNHATVHLGTGFGRFMRHKES